MWIRNLAIVLLAPIIFLVLIEFGSRVAVAIYMQDPYLLFYYRSFTPLKEIRLYARFEGESDAPYYKGKKNFSFIYNNATVTYNSRGYRTFEFDEIPDRTRLVTLGGSSTWGAGNNDNETWSYFLQQYVNEIFPDERYEVLNLGFGGYNTTLILNLLEGEVFGYKPDVLIIYSGYNDHTGGQWTTFLDDTWLKKFTNNAHNFLKSKLMFYRSLDYIMKFGFKRNVIDEGKIFMARYRANIGRIIMIAEKNDIAVVLVKQPLFVTSDAPSSAPKGTDFNEWFKGPYFSEDAYRAIRDAQNRNEYHAKFGRTYYSQMLVYLAIDEFAASYKHVYAVDFVNEFIRHQVATQEIFADVVHLTQQGNALLARKILMNGEFRNALADSDLGVTHIPTE